MLELYFIFYRIPKMMTRLARDRKRSAVAWTALAIVAWIGAEVIVGISVGFIHGIGVALWGWPSQSSGLNILTYVLALVAALVSVTVASRILASRPLGGEFPPPPPPPEFQNRNQA